MLGKGRKNVNNRNNIIFEKNMLRVNISYVYFISFSPFILNVRDEDKRRWANQIPFGAWRKGVFSIQPHAYILLSLISPFHDNGSWNESVLKLGLE